MDNQLSQHHLLKKCILFHLSYIKVSSLCDCFQLSILFHRSLCTFSNTAFSQWSYLHILIKIFAHHFSFFSRFSLPLVFCLSIIILDEPCQGQHNCWDFGWNRIEFRDKSDENIYDIKSFHPCTVYLYIYLYFLSQQSLTKFLLSLS